jgi:hypothetical protein
MKVFVFFLFCYLASYALSQKVSKQQKTDNSTDDSKQINPEGCGRRNNENSSLKRFLSAKRSNQKDFGWLVLLSGKEGVTSGNLINSQWVLTRANHVE